MINLAEVGADAAAPSAAGVRVQFGIYLPGIRPQDGYVVVARVIHKADRFVPEVQPLDCPLMPVVGHPLDLWAADVTIPVTPGTSFGQSGTYLYRFQLVRHVGNETRVVVRWFTDPFARATDDVGQLSAFDTPDSLPSFAWHDASWKAPELDDLVVYELHVDQFNETFDGVIERLTYLKSLGVNCLELMPVASLKLDFDWGYGPLHYFAPSERRGGAMGFKRLVEACHREGVAVILDAVYQHVDDSFPYRLVYEAAGIPSPMIDGKGQFGPQIDYSQEFAREYVKTANLYWLQEYHVDGFRYDEVTDLYDGPTDQKYAKLAYDTYNESLKIPRFTPSGGTKPGEYSRIIQVPEALGKAKEVLRDTYSSAAWQNSLLDKAEDMARYGYVDDSFAHLLDASFSGYPSAKTVRDIAGSSVNMPVAPFQYVESHDHSQLISFVGVGSQPPTFPFANRDKTYKLQPFAIALYTCQGIPMIWEGQEFADNYVLPDSGDIRIHFERDVHWEYFYDDRGNPLIQLYRTLGDLRRKYSALRSRESYYYFVESRPSNGVLAYRRGAASAVDAAMVLLNFSDWPQAIEVPFPQPGVYREMIDDRYRQAHYEIAIGQAGESKRIEVPSNYGCIFVRQP